MDKKRIFIPIMLVSCLISVFIGIMIASRFNWTENSTAVQLETNTKSKERPSQEPPSQDVYIPGNTFVKIAKDVNPAVVYVSSTQVVKSFQFHTPMNDPFRDFFGDDFFNKFFGIPKGDLKRKSLGSGFIVSKDGYILTNNHVVKDAEDIKITLTNKNEYDAKVIGSDEDMDIALLKIDVKEDLPVVKLGDSDALEIGEWVVAIGNPFGLEHTVTVGVISAKGRSGLGTGTYEDFIQTDASINPGNSGGPLINIDGEVIGINVMIIWPGQGIGFAIPINMAKQILADLIKEGKVVRPWLGIRVQDLTADMAEQFQVKDREGVLISQVEPGTGAEKAGLTSGDIIKSVDDKAVKNASELIKEIQKRKVGQKVRLGLIRDGKEMTVEVNLTAMPEKTEIAMEKEEAEEKMGARVQELNPQLSSRYRISGVKRGVVVLSVEEGSLAEEMGLQEGDVILEINRKKIETVRDFEKAMKDARIEKGILLHIHRKGSSFYLTFKK